MAPRGGIDGSEVGLVETDAARPCVLFSLPRIAGAAEGEGDARLLQRPGDHQLGDGGVARQRLGRDLTREGRDLLAVGNAEARIVYAEVIAVEGAVRTDPTREKPKCERGIP